MEIYSWHTVHILDMACVFLSEEVQLKTNADMKFHMFM